VRLPVVLTREEVESILTRLSGTVGLKIRLLYGTGMRIMECMRLRVKDVDFARGEIVVRQGKGARDRMTVLPHSLAVPLKEHLGRVKTLHEADLEAGYGEDYLPDALARKYPSAPRQWAWQYMFPSRTRSVDPRSGVIRRHHADEKALQRAMQQAVRRASPSWPRPIPCVIRSPPTYCNRATASGRSRSFSVTKTCRPR
jgi:integrase